MFKSTDARSHVGGGGTLLVWCFELSSLPVLLVGQCTLYLLISKRKVCSWEANIASDQGAQNSEFMAWMAYYGCNSVLISRQTA